MEQNESRKEIKKQNTKILIIFFTVFVILMVISYFYYKPIIDERKRQESLPKTYNVCFMNDGEKYYEINVKEGELAEKPADPKKEGYIFSNWASHNHSLDGSEVFDFDEPVTSSITLFAHYKKIPSENQEDKRTKENYEKVKNGMSKDDVINILGEPSSTSETEMVGYGKTELFIYNIYSLTSCEIYFQNGKVYMKNWTSL